jgi:RNA recognition motif-containing protein
MPVRLYVGNLPKEQVDRQDLQAVFAEAGDFVSTKVIKDRKTGKCRGFGFVTVETDEQADEIIEKFNGYMFQEAALKIEKALPRSKDKGDEEPQAASSEAPSSVAPGNGGNSNSTRSSSSGRRNNKKSRRGSGNSNTGGGSSESFQVDPRWAEELAKLKEMLTAQASSS